MTLEIPPLSGSVMSATASVDGKTVAIQLRGTADSESRADLDALVKQLHAESMRLGVATVKVDLRELEFMNSSCFKIFVAWLAQLRDLEAAKQYKIQIVSNPNLLWQRRSLAALSCFAVDLVTIET